MNGPAGIESKLLTLAESAKYDVSCSSSGTSRSFRRADGASHPSGCSAPDVSSDGESRNSLHGIGSAVRGGVCHTWTSDGRCVSLLKILLSNVCINDCAYCMIRRSNDVPRDTFTAEELSDLTIAFYKRNYIEGLFLSSGIFHSPDRTMEQMLRCVRLLRFKHGFYGYIHMKIIPGADQRLVDEAGRLADRLSVNVELPSEKSLSLLAPQKDFQSIFRPMGRVAQTLNQFSEDRRKGQRTPVYAPAGQSTQIIVGASPESDLHILRGSAALYSRMNLKRVYYSAFVPVNRDKRLPGLKAPPLLREHRLYQSDWLLRYYGFTVDEILDEAHPNLPIDLDPKAAWALRNLHLFPVEINTADRAMLLRVPGLGIRTVEKILSGRRHQKLAEEDLAKLRISLKRAKYFLTVSGRYAAGRAVKFDEDSLRSALLDPEPGRSARKIAADENQLLLFPELRVSPEIFAASVTGEL